MGIVRMLEVEIQEMMYSEQKMKFAEDEDRKYMEAYNQAILDVQGKLRNLRVCDD